MVFGTRKREPPPPEAPKSAAVDFRVHVLISLQRAMWNMVTPELRSVSLRLVPDTDVALRFVFDHPPTEDEQELVEEVVEDLWDDLPPQTRVSSECRFVPVSTRRELEQDEEWFYLRREP